MEINENFEIQYCKKCLIPNSRPGVTIDDFGISNVWKDSVKSNETNWKLRQEKFTDIVKYAKSKSSGYDCLVPVSGGKDSTWQIVKCLEHGLNVLAVTWKTPSRSKIGQENLSNLISLGVDHIDYQINPKVEKNLFIKVLKSMEPQLFQCTWLYLVYPLKLQLNLIFQL